MSGHRDMVMVTNLQRRPRSLTRVSAYLLFLVAWPTFLSAAGPAKQRGGLQQLQDQQKERFNEYSQQIEKLAQECEEKGLKDAAKTVRERVFVPDHSAFRADKLPSKVRQPLPPTVGGDERMWQTKLRDLEKNYAKDICQQARRAATQGFPSFAYNLVREAALHDSDNQQARKILGFERHKDEWVTPFAHLQITKGNVWTDQFGWLPSSHVAKYALGAERYYNGRWIKTEKEKDLRRDFKNAWQVQTDHYLIKTNVSLERGVELGKALEDFHDFFHETFAGFFNSHEQLKKIFDGGGTAVRSGKESFKVNYYRTRQEYVDRLRKNFPMIEQTNGIYLTSDRVAHFYENDAPHSEGTIYHEATHQLFFESHRENRTICDNHHFWIIEGIACYMESFESQDEAFSLGDPDYVRFADARENLLRKKYYVPLREFSGLGMQEFQGAHELAKNYTQASGLARFFMHYDGGRYREALVNHLAQLYSNHKLTRENSQGLDELTGIDFEELDRQYREDSVAHDN